MIEINLYPGSGTGSSDGSSIDFNAISVKGMIFAAIVYLIVYIGAPYFYSEKLANWDTKLQEMRTEKTQLQGKMKVLKGLRTEIAAAKKEEQLLYKQLNVIKEILAEKKNPMRILLYLSRNTPENTWITKFKTEGRLVVIEGMSYSYSLIGKLSDALESSVFFANKLKLDTKSVKGDSSVSSTGRRLEGFTITGTVRQFE